MAAVIPVTCQGNVKVRFEHWPVVWLWPLSLVLMQLTLARVGDFEINLAVLACHLLELYLVTFYRISRPPDWQVIGAMGIILYCLTLGTAAREPAEFARSFAQVGNLVLMMLIAANVRIEGAREVGRSVGVFCAAAAMAGIVIIAQAAAFNLYGRLASAPLLGPFAPLGPGGEVYVPSPYTLLPRASGLYAEPSVAGWFMSFAAALALAVRRRRPVLAPFAALVCAAAAAATLSLTGMLGATMVFGAYLVFVRDRLPCKLGLGALAGAGLAAVLYHAWQLGILDRLPALHEPGTSLYFRLTAPSRLVAESLAAFPFGHALGQTDFIASRHYYINWEYGSQTDIDNTLLTVVFYFGIAGILLNLAYVAQLIRLLVARGHAVGLLMLGVLIAFLTTGSGWAHHLVLVIGYAILVGRDLLAEQRAPGVARGAPGVARGAPVPAALPAAAPPLIRLPKAAPAVAGMLPAAPPRLAWLRPGCAA